MTIVRLLQGRPVLEDSDTPGSASLHPGLQLFKPFGLTGGAPYGFVFSSIFRAADSSIDCGTDDSADNRGDPEQPQLPDGPTTDKYGYACAACRIDRCIGYWNADQVDQRQAKPDSDRCQALRCAFIRGAENDQQKHHRHHDLCDQRRQK